MLYLYLKEILKKTQFNYYHFLSNVLKPTNNNNTFLGIYMCTPYKFTMFG